MCIGSSVFVRGVIALVAVVGLRLSVCGLMLVKMGCVRSNRIVLVEVMKLNGDVMTSLLFLILIVCSARCSVVVLEEMVDVYGALMCVANLVLNFGICGFSESWLERRILRSVFFFLVLSTVCASGIKFSFCCVVCWFLVS